MTVIQLNMRAPATAKDCIQDITRRLRSDPTFEERLRTFLANEGANQQTDVREAIEDLQHRVRMLEYDKKYPPASRKAPAPATESHTAALETGDRTDLLETADSGHTDAGEAWTKGGGKGKKLTPAGVAEVERRLKAGHPPTVVARAIGVSPQSVQARKTKLREQGLVD